MLDVAMPVSLVAIVAPVPADATPAKRYKIGHLTYGRRILHARDRTIRRTPDIHVARRGGIPLAQ